MTSITERYDRDADAYLAWWAPVLEPTALRVLDEVAEFVDGDGSGLRLLDLGAGTGALSIAAAERWPGLGVVGVDASTGMLQVARREADRRLGRSDAGRLELVAGLADRLPVPDGAIDVVVSSFVLQLVPDRSRALAEIRRVLRPGGILAFMTWLASDEAFDPDEVFNDVLDEMEVAEPDEAEEARSGDFRSAAAAAAQVRRAGFRDVHARADRLEHRYDPSSYVDFLEHYAERSTFESLAPDVAAEVRARTAERLTGLPPERFTWQAPIVTIVGRRPDR
jgi:ubiquinone/menaquinone biosynthesis C-methylase UbiE